VRVYLVRQTAYEILKEWRVNVTAPVLKEEAYKPEAVTLEDISNKRVSADDIRALTPFSNLNRLVLLNAQFQDGAARELRRLQSVTHLTLAGSNVTDEDLPYLAELSRLEDLDLKATRITDVGLRMIAAFSALRRVDISRTRVTDATIGILKTLRPDLAIER
jgi:hypothetical protein